MGLVSFLKRQGCHKASAGCGKTLGCKALDPGCDRSLSTLPQGCWNIWEHLGLARSMWTSIDSAPILFSIFVELSAHRTSDITPRSLGINNKIYLENWEQTDKGLRREWCPDPVLTYLSLHCGVPCDQQAQVQLWAVGPVTAGGGGWGSVVTARAHGDWWCHQEAENS